MRKENGFGVSRLKSRLPGGLPGGKMVGNERMPGCIVGPRNALDGRQTRQGRKTLVCLRDGQAPSALQPSRQGGANGNETALARLGLQGGHFDKAPVQVDIFFPQPAGFRGTQSGEIAKRQNSPQALGLPIGKAKHEGGLLWGMNSRGRAGGMPTSTQAAGFPGTMPRRAPQLKRAATSIK